MTEPVLTCPECGSDRVTTEYHQMFMVNGGDHYCHLVKPQDVDSPATCLVCLWEGERGNLKSKEKTMTEPTDAEIIALADATRTAEGGANGYILPISFCRAVLAKWGTPPAVAERLEVTEAECEAAVLELEIEDLHTTPPTQATDSVLEDAAPTWRCQHCIDRHDGIYGSWAAPCPYHDDDGKPRIDAAPTPPTQTADSVTAPASGANWQDISTAPKGAVPLTLEVINAMAREYPAEDLCGWSYRMGVADAEAHHGIKGGQHGAE